MRSTRVSLITVALASSLAIGAIGAAVAQTPSDATAHDDWEALPLEGWNKHADWLTGVAVTHDGSVTVVGGRFFEPPSTWTTADLDSWERTPLPGKPGEGGLFTSMHTTPSGLLALTQQGEDTFDGPRPGTPPGTGQRP